MMFRSKLSVLPSRGDCLLRYDAGHAELEFRNPAAKNAISIQMMVQLSDVVKRLEENPPVCLLIYGDDVFCAGGDLSDVRRYLMGEAREMSSYMSDLLNRIQRLPSFVIAAVDGAAIGGGAEICTVADHVICHQDATVAFVHTKLGVSPGWGGAKRLISKVGRTQALFLLTTGSRCTAETLLKMQLVDDISRTETAVEAARNLIANIESAPKSALKAVIRIVKQGADEHSEFATLWGSKPHRMALGLDDK